MISQGLNKRLVLFAAVVLILSVSVPAVAQLPADSIYAVISKEIFRKRTPGIIVGLIDSTGKRQIISAGALSKIDPRRPDGNTMYEIGSVTKVFTSLLLADMSLKQQVSINDPITRYLPSAVKISVKDGKVPTLLNLSSHTVGYPRMPDNVDPKDPDNPFADYTLQQLYDYVSRFPYTSDMGTFFRYSNSGYALLGNILASVAHKDYETLVKQGVCEVLDMKNTTIRLTPAQKANMAMGHSEYGLQVSNWDMPAFVATGALRSNVNDLLNFAAANLGIVKTKLWPAMELCHIPRIIKSKVEGDVTMGWTLVNENGHEFLWKDGTTAGYRALVLLDRKKKNGLVILSNCLNPINDIAYHILDPIAYPVKPYQYKWALLDTIKATINRKGVAAATTLYYQLKQERNPVFVFDENQLNYIGNDLRSAGRMIEAIGIWQLNAKEYPNSPMVYESLGDAYKRSGNTKVAIENFEKVVKLDTGNAHAVWMLKELRTIKPVVVKKTRAKVSHARKKKRSSKR